MAREMLRVGSIGSVKAAATEDLLPRGRRNRDTLAPLDCSARLNGVRLTNGDNANFGQEEKNRRRTRKNGYDHEDVCKGARVSARSDDDGIRVDPRRSRGRGVHRLRDHGYDHQERAVQRGQPTLIEKGEIPGWRTNPSATPHQKISICS